MSDLAYFPPAYKTAVLKLLWEDKTLIFFFNFDFTILMHNVRQFNSQNGPVKAKFAYLCTSGCCRIRNTLLVKLCTS
jgi:hypothetical protein